MTHNLFTRSKVFSYIVYREIQLKKLCVKKEWVESNNPQLYSSGKVFSFVNQYIGKINTELQWGSNIWRTTQEWLQKDFSCRLKFSFPNSVQWPVTLSLNSVNCQFSSLTLVRLLLLSDRLDCCDSDSRLSSYWYCSDCEAALSLALHYTTYYCK